MAALAPTERENPFLIVQRKFDGFWNLARKGFELEYGDHRNWPTGPQPLNLDGYRAAVVPMYDWLELQADGSNVASTLAFNPLDGRLDSITLQEGQTTTILHWFSLDRRYKGSEGDVELAFKPVSNLDGLIDVHKITAKSGNAWTYYKRTERDFPVQGKLVKQHLYHNGPIDTPGNKRLAELPPELYDNQPMPVLLGHTVDRRIKFSDEVEAALDRAGINRLPLGGPFS